MLHPMANKTPPFWPSFFREFILGMLGFALVVLPAWYFLGDEIIVAFGHVVRFLEGLLG